MATRRTPALTVKCREMFEEEFRTEGWQPGGTTARIAEATGLTVAQVRDAIFAESADNWRRGFARALSAERASRRS